MKEGSKKDNSFRKAFYYLKSAELHFDDTIREYPNTIGAKASKKYLEKIKWCFNDFRTDINFPQYALSDFNEEMNGDILFHESISAKCLCLTDNQKSTLEDLVDRLIAGEKITVELNKTLE